MAIKVLALDLERTLIDNALSGRPRPGLHEFLVFCRRAFERVVLYTTVEEADARDVMTELDQGGLLPTGFLDSLEYVAWGGEYKDLCFVSGATSEEILLVDDDAGWVRPDQRGRWVAIVPWDGGPDRELSRVQSVLNQLLIEVAK